MSRVPSSSSSRVPSGSSTTVPFTPKPTRRTSGYKPTFTDQELNKFIGTLASSRKVRPDKIIEELDNSGSGEALFSRNLAAAGSSRQPSDSRRSASIRDHQRPSSRASRPPSLLSQPPVPSASLTKLPDGEDRRLPHAQVEEPVRASSSRNKVLVNQHVDYSDPVPERQINVRVELDDEDDEAVEAIRLLDDVPLEIQEAWICEELLFALQGVEGNLLRFEDDYDPIDEGQRIQGARWTIDPSLDPSLLSLVERLLPLATYFTSVEAYMELRNTPEYGMVSHALGSGIRSMLKEYRILTAQLESLFLQSSTFTLQTLYFHLHPTLHTMSLLSSLCLALESDEDPSPLDKSSDDDDDGFGGMAEELGLGGAGLKGLMKNLKAAENGVSDAGPILGGEVLGIISDREATMSGDPTAATLHSSLLLHASQPYLRMLLRWISSGHLADPFDEFMVKESGHITKGVLESDYTDEYWERRYTLRDGSSLAGPPKGSTSGRTTPSISASVPQPRAGTKRLPGGACIPSFLQPWKHKILLAGKYLNVIRECGIEVKKDYEVEAADLQELTIEPKFYKRVEDAYIYANKTLLKLMLEEQELIPHLRSMKHFFFVDQSDFLTNFLDLAASELRKPSKSASMVKLQSLLDLAVRNPASSSSNDAYKDDLKVSIQSTGLYEWLLKIVSKTGGGMTDDGELDFGAGGIDDGDAASRKSDKEKVVLAIDALAFDYSVKFPLSLIISRKTITRYQIIFRFLLHLHHLESALSAMWLEHKAPQWRKHCGHEDMERWKSRIFSLRSRMLSFVRQVLAYATGEVLETNWRNLEAKLAKVETVDQLMKDHVDFLDTCLKQCMLTTSKLLTVYAKLMTTMSAFVSYQTSFNIVLSRFIADPTGESDPVKVKQRWGVLEKFEINFNYNTKLHLDVVTYNAGSENVALLALVTRLHQITRDT